jgi:hypothetical protein
VKILLLIVLMGTILTLAAWSAKTELAKRDPALAGA